MYQGYSIQLHKGLPYQFGLNKGATPIHAPLLIMINYLLTNRRLAFIPDSVHFKNNAINVCAMAWGSAT